MLCVSVFRTSDGVSPAMSSVCRVCEAGAEGPQGMTRQVVRWGHGRRCVSPSFLMGAESAMHHFLSEIAENEYSVSFSDDFLIS